MLTLLSAPLPPSFNDFWWFIHFGSFDNRDFLFHTPPPTHSNHPLCPLSPRGTLQFAPPPAHVFSFLTFLSVLTSLLLFLSCSGSLLTRPNGRQLNQGLPSLPPREERPLVSPLPSISVATFFFFFLFAFIRFSFFFCPHVTHLRYSVPLSFSHVSVQKIGIFLFQNPVFSFRFSSRRYREL